MITLKRANIILNAIKEHKIIDQLVFFKKIILEAEKDLPYTIDQKSVKTIVQLLAKEGHLNWIKLTLGKGALMRKYNLVCLKSITEEDEIVIERIEQAKFKYNSVQNQNSDSMANASDNDEQGNINENEINWSMFSANFKCDDTELIYQPSAGRKYGLEPKMKKIVTFYKFIFYTLSDECKKENGFETDDWRKYISPLPKSYEKETCLLGDLILRIPLSVFVKVVFITFIIPGLDEILKDPVRRHFTLQMLPTEIV